MNTYVQRQYKYEVYRNGAFIADLAPDVLNPFEHDDEINTGGGGLTVALGRSFDTGELREFEVEVSLGVPLEVTTGDALEGVETVASAIGTEDSEFQLDDDIVVRTAYGKSEPIEIDNAGTDLEVTAGEPLHAETGSLGGLAVFRGFISSFAVDAGPSNERVILECLPYSADAADKPFETGDSSFFTNLSHASTGSIPVGGSGSTDAKFVSQVFRLAAQVVVSRFLLDVIGTDPGTYPNFSVTMRLFRGLPTDSTRVLLQEVTKSQRMLPAGSEGYMQFDFSGQSTILASMDHHVEIQSNTPTIGPTPALAISLSASSAFVSGNAWRRNNNAAADFSAAELSPTADLQIALFQTSNVTTRTIGSNTEMSIFFATAVNDSMVKGARYSWSLGGADPSIQRVGINLGGTFKQNSTKQVIDYIVKAAPEGWFYRYDMVTNQMSLKRRSDTADHIFAKGKHLKSVELKQSIEDIVNKWYVLGGETVEGDPTTTLYKTYTDAESVSKWGLKVGRIEDGRIRVQESLDTIGYYNLITSKDPKWYTTVAVLDEVYDIELINVGDMVGFEGFGNFTDSLLLQVIRRKMRQGYAILTLGALPPTERRRVEDLKRRIDLSALQNIPDSTS